MIFHQNDSFILLKGPAANVFEWRLILDKKLQTGKLGGESTTLRTKEATTSLVAGIHAFHDATNIIREIKQIIDEEIQTEIQTTSLLTAGNTLPKNDEPPKNAPKRNVPKANRPLQQKKNERNKGRRINARMKKSSQQNKQNYKTWNTQLKTLIMNLVQTRNFYRR